MIRNPAAFTKGLLLAVTFFIVLFIIFLPIWGDGQNGLRAADRLFNSISKDSSFFIPRLQKNVNERAANRPITASLSMKSDQMALNTVKILTTVGATADASGPKVNVNGDLGKILSAMLADAEVMFNNNDAELTAKYGFNGKEALYTWWNIAKELEKAFTRQGKFAEARLVAETNKRGVEVAYNYFGIKAKSAADNAVLLTAALIFYVIYTLWWGIAILFLFEGIGLEMKAGAKKEV